MPESDFDKLRAHLLRSGVAPRYVTRAISELRDHIQDIESEAAHRDISHEERSTLVRQRIGAVESIAEQYSNRRELKGWVYRHPQLARVGLPLAYFAILPAVPVLAGVHNARLIGRWCTSLFGAAVVTAAMLLVLQLSITLT